MAKYTSSMFNDFRGKIGGVVGSKNGSGNFARKSNIPIDHFTSIQSTKRVLLAYLAQLWKTVGIYEIVAWNQYAALFPRTDKLGKTYFLSGFQFFMYCNLALANQNIAPITIAPVPSVDPLPNMIDVTIDINATPGLEDIKVNTPTAIPIGYLLILEATGIVSSGCSYPKGFKYFTSLDSTFISGGSVNTQYLAKFRHQPGVDNLVWFRWSILDTAGGFHGSKTIKYSTGTI